MNERIKELIRQATSNISVDHEGYRGKGYTEQVEYFNKEKFAELIVRECCLQVADVRIENDFEPVGDAVLVRALAGIKQHFGVKE